MDVSLIQGRHLLSYCHDLLGQELFQVLGGLGHVASLLIKVATILKYSRHISNKVSQTPVLIVIHFALNGLKIHGFLDYVVIIGIYFRIYRLLERNAVAVILNKFEGFLDKLLALAAQLFQVGEVELGVRITAGTHVFFDALSFSL